MSGNHSSRFADEADVARDSVPTDITIKRVSAVLDFVAKKAKPALRLYNAYRTLRAGVSPDGAPPSNETIHELGSALIELFPNVFRR